MKTVGVVKGESRISTRNCCHKNDRIMGVLCVWGGARERERETEDGSIVELSPPGRTLFTNKLSVIGKTVMEK